MLEVQIKKTLPHFLLDIEWKMNDEIMVLFGPSGSGKTTTLNCMAGLEDPDEGFIGLNQQAFFHRKQE